MRGKKGAGCCERKKKERGAVREKKRSGVL